MTILQEFQKKQKRKITFCNLQENCWMREKMLLIFFEKGTFPYKGNAFKTKKKKESEEEIKDAFKKFIKYIQNESKGINYDLFKDYFDFAVPSVLAKKLFETKGKKKNNELVELIKDRWSN